MRLLRVLMMVVAAIACTGVPARADDISAAARGVVRVVIIAQADGEELGRGHGSGSSGISARWSQRKRRSSRLIQLADVAACCAAER